MVRHAETVISRGRIGAEGRTLNNEEFVKGGPRVVSCSVRLASSKAIRDANEKVHLRWPPRKNGSLADADARGPCERNSHQQIAS